MKKLLLFVFAAAMLGGCNAEVPKDLKSPCVGAAGSPCDRRPVNDWWMS